MKDQTSTAAQLNQQLEKLYNPYLSQLNTLVDAYLLDREKLSWPFLMHVHDEYTVSPKKIMFVGMETHGWNDKAAAWPTYMEVTALYQSFIEEEKINSPFWWFIRDLSLSQQIENFKKSVAWTNLSKVSYDKKRPTGLLFDKMMPLFLDLLVEEVQVLQPDILIIMTTNPHYQRQLNNRFGFGASESSDRVTLIDKRLFKLTSPELSENTFQLSHPNRLRFTKGGYSFNANEIIQVIQANLG